MQIIESTTVGLLLAALVAVFIAAADFGSIVQGLQVVGSATLEIR
jgi:hypothetical protein